MTVSPDKPTKTEAAAKAETAEQVEPVAAADKPDKSQAPSKPDQAEKNDPAQEKVAPVKADPTASAEPAADKPVKTEAAAKAEKNDPAQEKVAPVKADPTASADRAADKPVKTEAAAEAEKTDPAQKKVAPVKADPTASADPAAPKASKADATDKPAKAAKPAPKPKPEDKPFANFIQEDLLPSLTKSLTAREQAPISLKLVEGERPVVGGQCWMVQGELPSERRFWLCFESDAITSGKTIALAESGSDPSLLESFLIDEKRINLALLESRLLQRLNGQKWFGGN